MSLNNEENNENGIFLNGKGQIIEMLQYMTSTERETLIKNVKIRNPHLADELMEKSLSFNNIDNLNDMDLQTLFSYLQPAILGIAIKTTGRDFQKRVLSLLARDKAEEAYNAMRTPITNEEDGIKRAQNKILNTLISLCRRKQITL